LKGKLSNTAFTAWSPDKSLKFSGALPNSRFLDKRRTSLWDWRKKRLINGRMKKEREKL